ncbi:MAG: hypothetical protein WAT39_17715 [Planctomycetota bacterium]
MNAIHRVIAIALVSACAQAQWAATPTWTQPSTNSPGIRVNYPLSTDTARNRVLLFGGIENSLTWEWNGSNWLLMSPATAPAWRHGGAIAFDAVRAEHVMFGGGQYANILNETWVWNGINWAQRTPAVSPSSRREHVLVFEPFRQVVLLYGGHNGGPTNLSDTWEWDGTNWTQLFPAHNPGPWGNRTYAYDSLRGEVVLYGAGPTRDQTWIWNGMDWVQRFPVHNPGARPNGGMAFVPPSGRAWLYGGETTSFLGGTWSWDGTDWHDEVTNGAPCAAPPYAGAYDPVTQRFLVFVGHPWSPCGTWLLQAIAGNPVTATASAYGAGCGNPALAFAPTARPVMGTTCTAAITNAPTTLAAVAMGWSNTFSFPVVLPFELSGIGMPGCYLLQSFDVPGLGATPVGAGTLQFGYPVPGDLGLLGAHVYLQAYCLAPGTNPLGVIVSNGIDWLIGNQ